MKIAMLLEDNENSQLGRLLKHYYNSDNLYFSRSNSRLFKKCCSIYEKYDMVLIFFDLSPSNSKLIDVLEDLSTKLACEQMLDKVHIVPIICSEFIYLNSLIEYLGVNIADFSISNTINYHKSCEKYYKHILEDKVNVGEYSKNEADYFYACFPIFDVIDSKHESYLRDIGITVINTSLDDTRADVSKFYRYAYSLFNLDFDKEVLTKKIALF